LPAQGLSGLQREFKASLTQVHEGKKNGGSLAHSSIVQCLPSMHKTCTQSPVLKKKTSMVGRWGQSRAGLFMKIRTGSGTQYLQLRGPESMDGGRSQHRRCIHTGLWPYPHCCFKDSGYRAKSWAPLSREGCHQRGHCVTTPVVTISKKNRQEAI